MVNCMKNANMVGDRLIGTLFQKVSGRDDAPGWRQAAGSQSCRTCAAYEDDSGTCTEYSFMSNPGHVCDEWKERKMKDDDTRKAAKAVVSGFLEGGLADSKQDTEFDKQDLEAGQRVEMEHTDDPDIAREIAKDHLAEHDEYYDALKAMEGRLEAEEEEEEKAGNKQAALGARVGRKLVTGLLKQAGTRVQVDSDMPVDLPELPDAPSFTPEQILMASPVVAGALLGGAKSERTQDMPLGMLRGGLTGLAATGGFIPGQLAGESLVREYGPRLLSLMASSKSPEFLRRLSGQLGAMPRGDLASAAGIGSGVGSALLAAYLMNRLLQPK